jgi:type II secretory pathway pseudopilin PulG
MNIERQMSNVKGSEGFTLLEFLIYFSILGIVLTAVVGFTLDVLETRSRVQVIAETEQNLRFGLLRILRGVRTAHGLNIGESAFDDDNGVLSLETETPASDPTVFDLSGGILRVAEGAGPPVELTSGAVEITRLRFSRDSLPGGTKSVTVSIEARFRGAGLGKAFRYSDSASGTAVIRKQR